MGEFAANEAVSDTLPVHGGDLGAIGARYGIEPATLLDFSANLNPLGPPPALLRELETAARDIEDLARYPEPDARTLREALGAHLAIDPAAIVIGNGAAALFCATFAALGAKRVVAPVPAFSEDRHAARLAGATFVPIPLDEAADFAFDPQPVLDATRGAGDVAVLTNPHNPTGYLTPACIVRPFAAALADRAAALVVDEAFIDYAPDEAVTNDAESSGRLVCIRSLTKFYAVPALRVGFAVARPDVATAIRARLPSWPVTSLASRAVAAALSEAAYARRTLDENRAARSELIAGLQSLGCKVFPAVANFAFVRLPAESESASALTGELIRSHHVVVRDCTLYEGLESGRFVRIAVRSQHDNRRLLAAMAAALAATKRG